MIISNSRIASLLALAALACMSAVSHANTCRGPLASEVDQAQTLFSESCCTTYNGSNGFHFCEWVGAELAWQCAAREGSPDANACATEQTNNSAVCFGEPMEHRRDAKSSYRINCGQPWNGRSGHHSCEWTGTAWLCQGPSSVAVNDPIQQPDPDPIQQPNPNIENCDVGLADWTQQFHSAGEPASPVDVAIDENHVLTWRQVEIPGIPVSKWNICPDGICRYTVENRQSYTIRPEDRQARFSVVAINGDNEFIQSRPSNVVRRGVLAFPLDEVHNAAPAFLSQQRRGDRELAGTWETVWADEFNVDGLPNSDRWHFNVPEEGHLSRETVLHTADHAIVENDMLAMDAIVNDDGLPEMSYLRSYDFVDGVSSEKDFFVDPTQGPVYIEANVRLDQAQTIYHGWWAFWLFTNNFTDRNGDRYQAYGGGVDTGSEVDIFEYSPDVSPNGFNSAIFLDTDGRPSSVRRPNEREYSYENALRDLGHNLVDGRFHKLGMYYSQDVMRFFIDGEEFWRMDNPDFITQNPRLGLTLSWEGIDNSDGTSSFNPKQNPARCGGHRGFSEGSTFTTPTDGTVYIDYVRVHRKTGS